MKKAGQSKNRKPTLFIQQPDFDTNSLHVQDEFRLVIHVDSEKVRSDITLNENVEEDHHESETNSSESIDEVVEQEDVLTDEEHLIGLNEEDILDTTHTPYEEPQHEDISEHIIEEDNIEIVHVEVTESNELSTNEEDTEAEVKNEELTINKMKIKNLVKRLAVYPNVLERPMCEMIVNGSKVVCQIISKRGDKVRIRRNRRIEVIHLDEIQELSIIQ